MATTFIISIISIYFLFLKIRIKDISIEEKTEKARRISELKTSTNTRRVSIYCICQDDKQSNWNL